MPSVLAIYFCMLVSQIACRFSDDNYTLYEVTAFNYRERALLYFLYVRNDNIVFLNGITNQAALPMDIVVDGCCTKYFEEKMRDNDIEYVKLPKEKLMANKLELMVKEPSYPYAHVPNLTTEFHRWETLMLWVESKLQKFPILSKIQIAKSFEKREIFVLKISTGRKNIAVFLLGGEEGRDWLTPALLLNFVSYILEQKLHLEQLIKRYDFYILPLLNPDGYEFSMTKDRYWAQNRKLYFTKKMCPKNESTVGINIDRNWFLSKELIRNEECDPVYSGAKSLSEQETASLAKFLDSIALQMLAFINLRSFEYLITIPYGYDHETCNNYPVLHDILSSVRDRVVQEHNKSFFYGTTAHNLYNFTGNVADWVKWKLNTPIVYTMYMKADDYFFPKPKDIKPLTEEFSTMIKEILLLASSIYSPLFNHQIKHYIQTTVILLNIFMVCAAMI